MSISVKEEAVAWLRKVSIFKSLGDEAVKQVLEQGRWRSFPKDTVIIHEGRTGNTMYVIRQGEVSVRSRTRYALNSDKKNNTSGNSASTSTIEVDSEIAKIPENGFFGELALLNANSLRSADVVAVTDCKCLEVDRNTFCEIINPTVKLTTSSQERSYEKERETYERWRAHKLAEDRKRERHASRSKSADMRMMQNIVGNQRNKRGGQQRSGSLAQRSSIGRHSLALDELFADDDGKLKTKSKSSRRNSTLTDIPEVTATK